MTCAFEYRVIRESTLEPSMIGYLRSVTITGEWGCSSCGELHDSFEEAEYCCTMTGGNA